MTEHKKYQGFYIVFTPYETITEDFEETRCINPECKNHKYEQPEIYKFCPECGSKVDWVDVDVIHLIDYRWTLSDTVVEPPRVTLHDWFWSPEYIHECIDVNFSNIDVPKESEIIILNRDIDANHPSETDIFMEHPITKQLLNTLKQNYEIHYGIVHYSI
jgi:hypothetical protein